MCGIFGLIVNKDNNFNLSDINQSIRLLFKLSELRGKDACGLAIASNHEIKVFRRTVHPLAMLKSLGLDEFLKLCLEPNQQRSPSRNVNPFAAIGHCRLVTDGSHARTENNHPLRVGKVVGVHNGIVTNARELLQVDAKGKESFSYEGIDSGSDTLALYEIINSQIKENKTIAEVVSETFRLIEGSASIAFFSEIYPVLCLATNTGSLYCNSNSENGFFVFASEFYILEKFLKKAKINKKRSRSKILKILPSTGAIVEFNNITPELFHFNSAEKGTRKGSQQSKPYSIVESGFSVDYLRRCSKCILPETYPFISFDENGVCYYCHKYEDQVFHGQEELEKILDKYRSKNEEPDCLVGLSGGRDSSYGLHLLKTKFGMHPIAYTYDWGLTTDKSRRNQALICGKLGVEHIIRAADISKKRRDIRDNIYAWLKKPELGMVPLFFAGDKPFIYYGRQLLKETNLPLTVHCAGNQLEQMEFKIGFCGINQHLRSNPKLFSYDFMTKVRLFLWYSFQYLRNPSYINKSLLDSAFAFHSSFTFRDDALFLYHYIPWNEKVIEETLEKEYGWQHDKRYGSNQWRMDDGQTSFTNYIYYTIAGFSEFDNFRSNQVRAGLITRDEALELAREDNKPRIEALHSFSQLIGFNLEEVLTRINEIPKLYRVK